MSEEALTESLDSKRGIISGKNLLVSHMVNRDKRSDRIGISLYASSMRASPYLSEKNKRVTFFNRSS